MLNKKVVYRREYFYSDYRYFYPLYDKLQPASWLFSNTSYLFWSYEVSRSAGVTLSAASEGDKGKWTHVGSLKISLYLGQRMGPLLAILSALTPVTTAGSYHDDWHMINAGVGTTPDLQWYVGPERHPPAQDWGRTAGLMDSFLSADQVNPPESAWTFFWPPRCSVSLLVLPPTETRGLTGDRPWGCLASPAGLNISMQPPSEANVHITACVCFTSHPP